MPDSELLLIGDGLWPRHVVQGWFGVCDLAKGVNHALTKRDEQFGDHRTAQDPTRKGDAES